MAEPAPLAILEPGRSWTWAPEYKRLSSQLARADGRDFEREALPILRLLWPDIVAAPPMGGFDRIGVDQIAFGNGDEVALAVQLKGFQVVEPEIGTSQVDQCLKSIEAFLKERTRADVYLIIHNRDARNAEFRDPIEARLRKMVDEGQAREASLWSRQQLVAQCFEQVDVRIRDWLRTGNLSTVEAHVPDAPVREVPYTMRTFEVGRHGRSSGSGSGVTVGDPSDALRRAGREGHLCLLVGEAGYGKTTAAARAAASAEHTTIYVQAATLPADLTATKDLAEAALRATVGFQRVPPEDRDLLAQVGRPVFMALLSQADTTVTLILDGLDESVFFTRQGGLQWLFNLIREVRVPVVLCGRTEFWQVRQADFDGAIVQGRPRGERRTVELLELLTWGDLQIRELAVARHTSADSEIARTALNDFLRELDLGQIRSRYGDIVERPLFLDFLLDWVAVNGLGAVSQAELVRDAVLLKVRRDRIAAPQRVPISETAISADTTMELSWVAMRRAAELMTKFDGDELQMLSACDHASIVSSDPRFGTSADPLPILLHSLLVPLPKRPEAPLRVAFSHRVLQEFFLAVAVSHDPDAYRDIVLPDPVLRWLGEFQSVPELM
jgi:hypothetical protein